jgi:hypothetical protein
LADAQLIEHRGEELSIFGDLDRLGRSADNRDAGFGETVS